MQTSQRKTRWSNKWERLIKEAKIRVGWLVGQVEGIDGGSIEVEQEVRTVDKKGGGVAWVFT